MAKAKSKFAQTEIQYLGHVVNAQGIRPDPKKVSAVQSWPVPKNIHVFVHFWGSVIISASLLIIIRRLRFR